MFIGMRPLFHPKMVLLFCLLWLTTTLLGQWREPASSQLSAADGLTAIWSRIMQDSIGHMYMATNRGLFRYDGSEFEFFGHDARDSTTIAPGPIQAICESRDGHIWLGTRTGGLCSFDRRTNTFRRWNLPGKSTDKPEGVFSILESSDGTLWISASEARLIKFDKKRDSLICYQPKWFDIEKSIDLTAFYNLEEDYDGNHLWMTLYYYDLKEWQVNRPVRFDIIDVNFVKHYFKEPKIFSDSIEKIYLLPRVGDFLKVDQLPDKIRDVDFLNKHENLLNNAMSVFDINGRMHIATQTDVFQQNDDNSVSSIISYPKTRDPMPVFVDEQSGIWISHNQQLNIYDRSKLHVDYYSFKALGIPRFYPGCLTYDTAANTIYVSSGIQRGVRSVFRVPLDKSQAMEEIKLDFLPGAIGSGSNNRIWVSGNGKLHEIIGDDGAKRCTTIVDNNIPFTWNLNRMGNGYIVGVGLHQLIWFHEDSVDVHRISFDSLVDYNPKLWYIQGLEVAENDLIYLHSNFLYEVNMRTSAIRKMHYRTKDEWPTTEIYDIDLDRSGDLWMITDQRIVRYVIEDDSLFRHEEFTTKDGIFEPGLKQIYSSDRYLWLFGEYGMSAMDLQTYEVRSFNVTDALYETYFEPRQLLTLSDGRIATLNGPGLYIFHPDSLWKNKSTENIKTVIKEIRVNGESISDTLHHNYINDVKLNYGNHTVDISFQGLAFPRDDGVNYSYRLNSYGDDWIDIGENKFISFSSLESGEHKLEIKASTAVGQAPVRALLLSVPTPFYKLWYVQLLTFGALAGLFYYVGRRRAQRIRRVELAERERKNKMLEIELKALRSQMNPHFMFNSLNSIKSYILQSEPGPAAAYLSDFSHLVRMILQHSRENLITLEEELETLLLYIDLEKLRLENEFSFTNEVDDKLDLSDIKIPPLLLQPFVENAIWHGLKEKGDGQLIISIYQRDQRVLCEILDNGIGREKSAMLNKNKTKKYKSLGTGITNERIELINQMEDIDLKIDIVDLYDERTGDSTGTKVIVSFASPEME